MYVNNQEVALYKEEIAKCDIQFSAFNKKMDDFFIDQKSKNNPTSICDHQYKIINISDSGLYQMTCKTCGINSSMSS